MKQKLFNLLSLIFLFYLKLVAVTGRLEIINKDKIEENSMVGYWHGDSYCMMLVLRQVSKKIKRINVIVTADKRGDVIEKIISHYGAIALRIPDGLKIRYYLRQLKEASKSEGILATALDGPLGPIHEPKKLIFFSLRDKQEDDIYLFSIYSCNKIKASLGPIRYSTTFH